MLWRTEGIRLEDLVPVPKKQPGRHFSAGYHMLGNLAGSYDVKYAQMTYGDHYRKKIEDDIIRERNRLDEIMTNTKQQAADRKQSMNGSKSKKRYDLNELRHHQRRCAALLFGARQQGAHQVPYLVRWAPRRRESYYLMSERVYNDRLLMKLREQEEEEKRKMLESPLNFDFGDKFGNTSHLYDFQKFVSKTAKDIKGLSFDTEYKDYDYEFKEGEKLEYKEQQGRVMITPTGNDDQTSYSKTSKESKVKFGDVTDIESDHQGRLSRERRRAAHAARKSGSLDMNDIDVDFSPDALDDLLGEGEGKGRGEIGDREGSNLSDLLGVMSFQGSRDRRKKASSKFGNDRSQAFLNDDTTSYSSERTDDEDELESQEMDDGIADLGGVHNNKYCKHSPKSSLKKRSDEYYKKLPRLLKTSELRKKVTESRKVKPQRNVGPYVNHECMLPYKTAYERALALVRGRSLPQNPADLYNRTSRITFSYMPGMPGTEGIMVTTKSGEKRYVPTKTPPSGPQGMKGILGNVDMNHFYREEDELIYYVKDEEINVVVESSDATTESRQDDDSEDDTHEESSEAITRSTSEAYTLKSKASLDNTDNESMQ